MNDGANGTSRVVELDLDDCNTEILQSIALPTLETGGVLFFKNGFSLTEKEKLLIGDTSITLPTAAEKKSRNGRPTIIFDPSRNKIERTRIREPHRTIVAQMMARYSSWAEEKMAHLLPSYMGEITRDRVTFRPCLRAKEQGLHVDSGYGRPTGGRAWIRIFSNIDPAARPRRWQVGEDFESFAKHFLPLVEANEPSLASKILTAIRSPKSRNTQYDNLIREIRRQGKDDKSYQTNAPKSVVEFPYGSSWIAMTDLVLHGALAGQNSLDQTYFLPVSAMQNQARSALRILERLAGRELGPK